MDILISEELQDPAIDRLAASFKVVRESALWRDPARLRSAMSDARAIIVRNQTQLTAELLRTAVKLEVIGRVGVGLDNIDLAAASELGVVVVAPLNANATSVAELSIGFILALARKLPQGDHSTKAGGWDRKGCTGMEIEGKTLCLCGIGRVGAQVAIRARAFGMRLVAYDPFLKPGVPALRDTGVTLCESLEEALAGSDFVSVHVPLTPDTRKLFNQKLFAAMKPGAYFINTSRGGVVDEAALLAALQSHRLGGAALDVRETEPPGPPGELEKMPNVLLTPHIGAFTVEAQKRTLDAVTEDVDRVLSGKPALNYINFERPERRR